MGGSIAAGVAAINPDSAGLLILLCDQWRVQTQSDPTRIIAATTEGSLMPPAIFPARCFDELQQLGGDHGARSVINAHPRLVTAVPVSNAAFDLDTKTQLEALQKPK
jgi:molybdenum cofactor cytidylyltransferase